jgi:hypothetical protein
MFDSKRYVHCRRHQLVLIVPHLRKVLPGIDCHSPLSPHLITDRLQIRLAVEDDLFVDRVFGLVDEDGSGQIEWPE